MIELATISLTSPLSRVPQIREEPQHYSRDKLKWTYEVRWATWEVQIYSWSSVVLSPETPQAEFLRAKYPDSDSIVFVKCPQTPEFKLTTVELRWS